MDINLNLSDCTSLQMYDFKGRVVFELDNDDSDDYYYISMSLDKSKELYDALGKLHKFIEETT